MNTEKCQMSSILASINNLLSLFSVYPQLKSASNVSSLQCMNVSRNANPPFAKVFQWSRLHSKPSSSDQASQDLLSPAHLQAVHRSTWAHVKTASLLAATDSSGRQMQPVSMSGMLTAETCKLRQCPCTMSASSILVALRLVLLNAANNSAIL